MDSAAKATPLMKIGLDTIPLIYSRGADYRTTYRLYQEMLSNKRYIFSMLSISRDKQSPCAEMFANHPSIAIQHWHSPFKLFDWAWTCLKWPTVEWMMGDIDLYHATSIYAPPAKRAKVMITVRGIVAEVIPDKLPSDRVQALHRVLRKGLDGADYYSAVSQSTANDLEHVMGIDPDKIFVIPHGVDPIFTPPIDRDLLQKKVFKKFNLVNPYVLFVGAIGIHKNVLGVFDAWLKLYQNSDVKVDLCLVGRSDSAWDELQSKIDQYGVDDVVHQVGWVEPHSQDLVDLYGAAECFILPSFYEGWCSPPVEAMACGTPAIVSDVPSLVETVGEAAYVVNPNEVESIYDGLGRVLFDKEVRRMCIENGLNHAAAMNWRRSAEYAERAYDTIWRESH